VEEVVCHGHFCKVRSLKIKEEREDRFRESEERRSSIGANIEREAWKGESEISRGA